MRDSLGDRMKEQYERRTRYLLPRRTYTLIRVDGKAFHTLTRGCERPFDAALAAAMDGTAKSLCESVQGARLAYVQSDEISVLLTDFETEATDAWFDGSIQKIASISASMATAAFNRLWSHPKGAPALFDSRVFTIPDRVEVLNYFVWRQQDATRNSIQMAAQACFSQRMLGGKSTDELQELLWRERGINWNDYPEGQKRGRCVVAETVRSEVRYVDRRTGETRVAPEVERREWRICAPPVFSREPEWLRRYVPPPPGSE